MTLLQGITQHRRTASIFGLIAMLAMLPATSSARSIDDNLETRLQEAEAIMSSPNQSLTQLGVLSRALTDALQSEQFAFQTAALRMIITYGEQVDVGKSTIFEIVRLYRDRDDLAVRRMALVALGSVNDAWANDMMTRSVRFEKDAQLKHTLKAVLADIA